MIPGDGDATRGGDLSEPDRPAVGPAGEGRGAFCSVIIPTYNRARLVPEAVESVLAQTHREFEVIVVDDGSTDDTAAALGPYGDRIRCVRQPNRGLAAARNRGLREARGELVAFLDSDDLYEPEFLRRVLEIFRAHPDAGAVFVAEREFEPGGEPPGRVRSKRTPGDRFSPAGMIGRDTGVGSGRPPVIRRAWLERLGGFNESMRCAVDSEMWIRWSFHVPMVFLPEPLVRRRRHAGNLSRDRALDSEDWLRILAWLRQAHPEFVAAHPRLYRRTLGKHRLRLGRELLVRADGVTGRLARARRELLRAIQARPGLLRAYAYLGLSFVAPSTYGRWRRRADQRPGDAPPA
jgi:glycosyltransferase involved in cell wall biosynthesis